MFTNRGMEKEDMVHLYKGILLSQPLRISTRSPLSSIPPLCRSWPWDSVLPTALGWLLCRWALQSSPTHLLRTEDLAPGAELTKAALAGLGNKVHYLCLGSPKAEPETRIYIHRWSGRQPEERGTESGKGRQPVKGHINKIEKFCGQSSLSPTGEPWRTVHRASHGCPS